MFKLGRPVYIKWLDHSGSHGSDWVDFEFAADGEPIEVHSIGWIIKETSTYLTIAPHISGDHKTVVGAMTLIKKNIISRKTFK